LRQPSPPPKRDPHSLFPGLPPVGTKADVDVYGTASDPVSCGGCHPGVDRPQLFPLPRGALNEEPSKQLPPDDRWFGWQVRKFYFASAPPLPLPPRLRKRTREPWLNAERQLFDDRVSREGKNFRQMLQLFPGRTLADLVERYYESKPHKRLRQISQAQAARNIRSRPCGTMGCLLHDNHAGPHLFPDPVGPRSMKGRRRS